MPLRDLYHWGIAPRLRRQFLRGRRYTGATVLRPSPGSAAPAWPVASAQSFSNSAAVVWMDCSTSRAAVSTVSFIFLSSSSSMERLTSALTSAT